MSKTKIGFIGLGLMGAAMVQRMQDLGYPVTVMANRSRPRVDAAVARGAVEVTSPKEIAQASDIVMLCMDTSASVEGRMRGPDGVIAGLSEGQIVVDFGTSLPASTQKLAEEVAAAGGVYLDAPLGRTPAHAVDGLLNIMAAGDRAGFDRAEPVFQDLAENVFYLGASGAGHTIKLMNNFLGMTIASAVAESFAMADKAGVDRGQLYDVVAAGPLRSVMMDLVKGYAVDGDPNLLAFAIKNAAKDVGYYAQMTQDLNAQSIMSGAAKSALDGAVAAGHGERMVSEITDYFSEQFK